MKKLHFLAAVCCMAAVFTAMCITFVSCKKDKTDGPKDPTTEQNDGNQNEEETPAPVTYTLTVMNLNKLLGTVRGSGSYKKGTIVSVTAEPINGAHVFGWSDVEGTLSERAIELVSDSTIVVMFEIEGVESVDLGLSVKWATCNVGASRPEEYGNYYAWGEVEPKDVYDWSTYKWCNGAYNMTKYCTDSNYGIIDNKTVLEKEDDAAAVNMGGSWRMPTKAEQDELLTECTWTRTTLNEVGGIEITSKINGNSIFWPYAGRVRGSSLSGGAQYWSSTCGTWSFNACHPEFQGDKVEWYAEYRSDGRSVRGVCE
ncbi:MAG: hypothetical protein ACI30B_00580 [Paludibacteraceae bacterium]